VKKGEEGEALPAD